ncbi:hypothetical protein Y900_028285 [Mycolicibacterium aromaticivorans JS19b1 = JCM 16368]|uniref:Uncharacterized protein n=1 Tax=Mycolicibacterium aromaticivorans JS19b1 = JCM 16368 TaxID=1440774 RepID=A0A064C940_9MYCO|nr:hypothetical protein [Mycolicibacterium aromaticivorans]KDE97174.1 hypothetical protein Y900_028285 [Mycolicibacterium aromaticivorans JS19b1 = JCM 16368]
MSAPVDRFDEVRRRWIALHQHTFIFQKRRAELLAQQIRIRAEILTGARVDPADDNVIHPLWMRPNKTPYAALDFAIAVVAAVLAPIGWPAGRAVYKGFIQLIPHTLRSYPIAAFMWAAVVTGLPMVLLYYPDTTLAQTVLLPWVLGQLPATALAAGVYGILEGWLAVDGSRDWWPMRPPAATESVDFGLQPDDLTAPGIFGIYPTPDVGERTPIAREHNERKNR